MSRLLLAASLSLMAQTASEAQEPQHFVGEWRSEQSGHHGPMRARLTPTAGGYDMRVVGRFAVVFPFTYRTHLDVVGSTPEGPILAAEKKLPLFGGSFRTTGVLSPSGFHADYSAMKDSGKFTLSPRR